MAVGFIVYITVRGELPAYLCVVGIGSGCPNPPATVNQTTQTSTPSNTTIVNPPSNTTIINPPLNTGTLPPVGTTFNPPSNVFTTITDPGLGGVGTDPGYSGNPPNTCFDEDGFEIDCYDGNIIGD